MGRGNQLPPTSLRVNPIFNPMKDLKFIRLITFDLGLVFFILSYNLTHLTVQFWDAFLLGDKMIHMQS